MWSKAPFSFVFIGKSHSLNERFCDDFSDDEDEDEAEDEREEGDGARSSSRRNADTDAQLVEHSADELEGLNRDVLNAEITQLEGR